MEKWRKSTALNEWPNSKKLLVQNSIPARWHLQPAGEVLPGNFNEKHPELREEKEKMRFFLSPPALSRIVTIKKIACRHLFETRCLRKNEKFFSDFQLADAPGRTICRKNRLEMTILNRGPNSKHVLDCSRQEGELAASIADPDALQEWSKGTTLFFPSGSSGQGET